MAIVTPNTATSSSATTPTVGNTVASGTSTKTLGKVDQNYQDFLTLLTTQLQNQDPSAPTDTNQLTQQIATLSQVEQQLKTNDNLEKLISMYSSTQYNSVVSYIGKTIEAEGDVAALQKTTANFAYNLESDAALVSVVVKDKDGNVVRTDNTTGGKLAGNNKYVWDGTNDQGNIMPPGQYSIQVTASTITGDSIPANLTTGTAQLNAPNAHYVYYLGAEPSSVAITIKDKSGTTIRTDNTGGTKIAGRNEYVWDGKDNQGNIMPEGSYTITVAAKDASGTDMTSRTYITGTVTSVDSVDGVAYLSLGTQGNAISIPLQNVTSIRMADAQA